LAVITPALDPVEHAADAVQAAPALPESASADQASNEAALAETARAETGRAASRSARSERATNEITAERPATTTEMTAEPAATIEMTAEPAATIEMTSEPAVSAAEITGEPAATLAEQALTGPALAQWGPIAAAIPADTARADVFQLGAVVAERTVAAQRATRAMTRRTAGVRPAVPRRAAATLAARTVRAAEQSVARESAAMRRAAAARRNAAVAERPGQAGGPRQIRRVRTAVPHRRAVVTKHAFVKHALRVMPLGNGMTAVVAFARSQIGKRYVSGGEGPYGFDCSGFTKRAYARVGIRLPHSSGGQAARARTISRAQARPGDLVVGSGHVGIYMGGGMMIDAGNHRTGVVYRKLYSGLRVARL